jgi:hypothetical protein
MEQIRLLASLVFLTLAVLPLPASAWNIPGHMLSATIAYQILLQENLADHRQGKIATRETSLVREPMAGEAPRCSRC